MPYPQNMENRIRRAYGPADVTLYPAEHSEPVNFWPLHKCFSIKICTTILNIKLQIQVFVKLDTACVVTVNETGELVSIELWHLLGSETK